MNVLNERKLKILEAIINDYIVTAEPIGSRTIAKKYNMGISSATIRNEMSDLEEMGFIIQPHASAGRIPSDKGYRLYVDNLMHSHSLTSEEAAFLHNIVASNINHIDYLMKETAKAIAYLTNYTTIVSEPIVSQTKVKHLQLIPLDEVSVLLIVVTDSKAVKNQVLRTKNTPEAEVLAQLSAVLNSRLLHIQPEQMNQELLDELIREFGDYAYMVPGIVENILHILASENHRQVYTSGVKNILAFPEFSDLEKARGIFHLLEERDLLITLLENGEDNNKVQIIIGRENRLENMHDCSVIKAEYQFGGETKGSIGIIGPTRMDYPQVVAVLNGIVRNINKVISTYL